MILSTPCVFLGATEKGFLALREQLEQERQFLQTRLIELEREIETARVPDPYPLSATELEEFQQIVKRLHGLRSSMNVSAISADTRVPEVVRQELGALDPVALGLLGMGLDVAEFDRCQVTDQREQQQFRIDELRRDHSVVGDLLESTIEALETLGQLAPSA